MLCKLAFLTPAIWPSKKTTGKTPSEHVSLYVEEKKEEKKLKQDEAKIKKEMANYLQSHIELMRDKLNLKNKL